MKKAILALALALTLLVYNGCERVVYVNRECPKIQTIDNIDTNYSDINITYEVA